MSNQAVGLVLVATAIRRMPEFTAFESAKSMMRDFPPNRRRFGASIGQLHQANARPPGKHEGKACRGKGLMSVCSHLVLPYKLDRIDCSACGRARRKESSCPRRSQCTEQPRIRRMHRFRLI